MNMKRVIIGTAGHIDHGKTTLIRALTGRNTDRLPEEKKRGITIDLGFSYFELPDGTRAGIVDVPGHEKFIKNMLAGAAGIDIVLLVIAADEGIMPQTKEHLHILQLLGTKHGIVVITKTDMVEEEWLDMVKEDIADYIKNTFLEHAPIVEVSAINGSGIEELKGAILEEYKKVDQKDTQRHFRIPIDRVFSVHGYGTVITGTLMSGKISTGDELDIYPENLSTKARNLQVHDENVPLVEAGERVAINLSSLKVGEVKRGMVVAPPGMCMCTDSLDCKITLLDDSPFIIKSNQRIRLYVGSAEVMARTSVLGGVEIKQGESGFCRLKLEEDVACERLDRFVVRSYSPLYTIGGGMIINPYPKKRKNIPGYEDELRSLENASDSDFLRYVLSSAGRPLPLDKVSVLCSLTASELSGVLSDIGSGSKIISSEGYLVYADVLENFKRNITKSIGDFHNRHSLKKGISKEVLYSGFFKNMERNGFDMMLNILRNRGDIKGENLLSVPGFEISVGGEDKKAMGKVLSALAGDFMPPSIESFGLDEDLIDYMIEEGFLIKIDDGLCITSDTGKQLKSVLLSLFGRKDGITIAEYRDALDISRKYALAYLEYFDKIKLTRRAGDVRILIKGDEVK